MALIHKLRVLLQTMASVASGAGFNIPPGVAPSAPNNGDIWTTSTGLYTQVNGNTIGLGFGLFIDEFTASANQTVFTLTHTPISVTGILQIVNQIPQPPSATIVSISGKNLTVSSGLNAGDKIMYVYTRAD